MMTQQETHKVILLLYVREKEINKLRLLAVALHAHWRNPGSDHYKVHHNNRWHDVTWAEDNWIHVESQGPGQIWHITLEDAEKLLKNEVL